MNTQIIPRHAWLTIVIGLLAAALHVAGAAEPDHSLSPYFQVVSPGDDSAPIDCLPLKHSDARVEIDGTIARVTLTQRYTNTGSRPLEASYIFPASTRAAVHGMTMRVGERVLAARIRKRAEAKAEFEKAKAEHKTASLLEQERPNVFRMSVANILPGDEVEVVLEFSETLAALDGVYEFVLPMVVGPRYGNRTAGSPDAAEHKWIANPYLAEGEKNPAPFTIAAKLRSGLALASVRCPSHPGAEIDYQSRLSAAIRLDDIAADGAGDRDFTLRWRLGGNGVEAGLLLDRGKSPDKPGHFLLHVAPPKQVTPESIPPRDYLFILDVSGSMNGFPLNTAKSLVRDLVGGLRMGDTFNILLFAGGSEVLSDHPLPADKSQIRRAMNFIDNTRAGGGTELGAALKRALALPGGTDHARTVVVATDGFVSFEADVFELIRKRAGEANVFAIGIGSSVNRHLIDGIARAGRAEPFIVTSAAEATETAARFRKAIGSPVLTKIRIDAEGISISSLDPDPYPDVLANRPLTIVGKWTGEAQGRIVVRGIGGGGMPFEQSIDVAEAAEHGTDCPALPILWARERIRSLADFAGPAPDPDIVGQVTALGLAHSIVTRWTSFVAVDETPRPTTGDLVSVKQPLPLPKGVTASAVGGGGGGTASSIAANGSIPEPGTLGLLALVLTALAFVRRR